MKAAISYIKEVVENDGAVDDAMERLKEACEGREIKVVVTTKLRGILFSSKKRVLFVHKESSKHDLEMALEELQS